MSTWIASLAGGSNNLKQTSFAVLNLFYESDRVIDDDGSKQISFAVLNLFYALDRVIDDDGSKSTTTV